MNENDNEIRTMEDLRSSYENPYEDGTVEAAPESAEEAAEQPAENAQATDEVPAESAEETAQEPVEAQASPYDRYATASNQAGNLDRIAALEAQNAQLQAALQAAQAQTVQAAEAANESVAQSMQDLKMPVFDNEAYAYASDDERVKMMNDYTSGLMNYATEKAMKEIRGEIAPMIDEYRKREADSAFSTAIDQIRGINGFGDVDEYKDEVSRIAAMPEFASLDPNKRAVIAASIARGIRAADKPAPVEKDVATRADEAMADEALMRAIAERQARAVKDQNGEFPTHTASNGLSSASFPTPQKAETIEELRDKYSGLL